MASFRALGLGLILISFLSWRAVAGETLYSKLPIPPNCDVDYQKGNQFLAELINQGFDLGNRNETISQLDKAINQYSENDECRFFFSIGMFDAQSLLQQIVTLEYFLELETAERLDEPRNLIGIKELYRSRFTKLGLEPNQPESLEANQQLRAEALEKLSQNLNSLADSKEEAVSLGRFVFLGKRFHPMTLYDYDFNSDGMIRRGENNQEILVDGSYPRVAKENFERAITTAKEFIEWKPSLFFGEDSFLRGSFWRYFSKTDEPSLREVKSEGYHKLFLSHMSFARSLRLDTHEYSKIYQLMLKKERSTLERDIAVFDKMYKYRWAPVLIPVGMYVGGALLIKSGWFLALPEGTASFTFVGGSLAQGANASAAVSLLTITGYSALGARDAYQEYKSRKAQGLPFHTTDALDYIVGAAYQSFPLAAIAPVLVGSSVYSAHEIWVTAKSLISTTMSIGQTIQTVGVKGSLEMAKSYLVQLPGKLVALPQFVAQKWLESWYKNPKILISNYGADILMTLIFDCGYRQMNLEGKDVCVWKDETGNHINSQFLYTLSSTVIVGGLSKPVTLIPSFGLRWVTYRGVTLLSGIVSQLIVSGKLDSKRLMFDQVYGAGPSSVKGEFERYIRMSDWVQSRSVTEQTLLLIALRALVLSPIESPIKIYLQDRFVKGELKPIQELKNLMKEVVYLSIDDFDDSVVEMVLEDLRNEKEVISAITSSFNSK
ncbi:MAG: hypothetical protein ACKOA8_02390 [Deltaproteobacteria bacterium]